MRAVKASRLLFLSGLLSLAAGAVVFAASEQPAAKATENANSPATAPTTSRCPVETGNEADPAVVLIYQGKTITFCCPDCVRDFEKDPYKYLRDSK